VHSIEAKEPLDTEIGDVAGAAMDLHGPVGDAADWRTEPAARARPSRGGLNRYRFVRLSMLRFGQVQTAKPIPVAKETARDSVVVEERLLRGALAGLASPRSSATSSPMR
jgi:hypothetical protein